MQHRIITTLVAGLLAGLLLGYFLGRQSVPAMAKASLSPEAPPPAAPLPETPPASPPMPAAVNPPPMPAPATLPATPQPEKPAVPTEIGSLSLATGHYCFPEDQDISRQLTLFAESIEKQQLMYDTEHPDLLQDCSGIFLRVVNFMKGKCEDYHYPDPAKERDSRALARWFHEQGNLVIVNDPQEQRKLIRPGSVMFFGSPEKSYHPVSLDKVIAPHPEGIVFHVGVVTEVLRDEQGEVAGYVMFQGRSAGKYAQRTHYHHLNPPRFGFPPLGNWDEQWLAMSYIITPS